MRWRAESFYRLSLSQSGNERDDHFVYLGLRPVSEVFPKLSKLLDQEDALSAPCARSDLYSPRARPRGPQEAAERRNPSLSHSRLLHRVIRLARADRFSVVGGRCTGRARADARPNRAVVARRH
jgi:hypothetical protein